jgi:hypothetical protein
MGGASREITENLNKKAAYQLIMRADLYFIKEINAKERL